MLKRLVGPEVALRINTADEDLRVVVGTSQLEQVLLNLVINARDALPAGGTIEIDVCPDAGPPVPVHEPGATFVRIRVSDDGHGMSDVVRDRAFEPFFTTKGPGLGTGLGLSTVFGIAKQSGGGASIDSAPDAGTRVDVWFPAAAAPEPRADIVEPSAEVATVRPQPGAPSLAPCARVLVVEDDDALRIMVGRILANAGLVVDEAEHAESVVETYLHNTSPSRPWPTIMVTDVVMGECSGPELATAMRQRSPGLPVLFMSGFTEERLEPHHTEGGPTRFIAKPFTPHGLVDAVRSLLHDAAAPLADSAGPA
jgi:CheY-like chemotaxis protein